MSHQPERAEKICLNCNKGLHGRYCHQCGQENIVSQQTFWGFVKHFIDDFTHFDNKFFRTINYIVSKPGIMAREYCAGKRARFVPPVRAYLFTSAVFFLFFFKMNSDTDFKNGGRNIPFTAEERAAELEKAKGRLARKPEDSVRIRKVALLSDSTRVVTRASLDSLDLGGGDIQFTYDDTAGNATDISSLGTVEDYRKAQARLPKEKKDNWLERKLKERGIILKQKYSGRGSDGMKSIINIFLHLLPYMLFLSLPLFAALLKLLYVRRKHWFYSDHAVFTIHLFIFFFIAIFLLMVTGKLEDVSGWKIFDWLTNIILIGIPVYWVIAMRNFYQQSWGKTIGKFFIFNFLWLFMSLFLFVIFAGITFFQA